MFDHMTQLVAVMVVLGTEDEGIRQNSALCQEVEFFLSDGTKTLH